MRNVSRGGKEGALCFFIVVWHEFALVAYKNAFVREQNASRRGRWGHEHVVAFRTRSCHGGDSCKVWLGIFRDPCGLPSLFLFLVTRSPEKFRISKTTESQTLVHHARDGSANLELD